MSEGRYDELVALAEVELELAESGDFAALAPIQRAWRALTATLPRKAPLSAEAQLRRAAALNAAAQRVLRERAELARQELARLDHGRRALNGYAPVAARTARVDQSG